MAVGTQGYIHLIGGSIGGSKPTPNVWSIKLAPDGSILSWEQGPQTLVPLWFLNGGLVQGKVWIWGGLTDKDPETTNNVVFVSNVLASGQLGSWQPACWTRLRAY